MVSRVDGGGGHQVGRRVEGADVRNVGRVHNERAAQGDGEHDEGHEPEGLTVGIDG